MMLLSDWSSESFNPYLCHYSKAFAFSVIPDLPFYRLISRFAFPEGRMTGLPRSAELPNDGLGTAYTPVAQHLRQRKVEPLNLATYLLVTASQQLWLLSDNDASGQFTFICHTVKP